VSGFHHRIDPKRPLRRVEIINGAGGRRHWSAADKARILEETLAPGAVVSGTAAVRGYDFVPQLLPWPRFFAWESKWEPPRCRS
jgi:transposase